MQLDSSLRTISQRLFDPVARPLPFRAKVPTRIRPLLAAIPGSLQSSTHVLTASDYEIHIDEELLAQSLHNVKELETINNTRRELNQSTVKAAKVAAAGALVTVGVIGAAALVTAYIAASAAAVAAASAVSVVSADPAIIVDNKWCLSAWIPSEVNGRS